MLFDGFSIEGAGHTYKYLVNNDLLIVISSNNVVVTLYDVKVDSNEKVNEKKIRECTGRIRRNNAERLKKEAKKDSNNKNSRRIESIIEHMEIELAKLRTELEESIDVSRKHAEEAKKLRHENRDLMQSIMYGFKKFKE